MDRRDFLRGAGVGVAATLAILIWHFYAVIFRPDVYPMSWVWLSGKLIGTQMAEEHTDEFAEILGAERMERDGESVSSTVFPEGRNWNVQNLRGGI